MVAEAQMVLELHVQCSITSSTSHLRATIIGVVVLRLFENS
jgi:hypothetical protein